METKTNEASANSGGQVDAVVMHSFIDRLDDARARAGKRLKPLDDGADYEEMASAYERAYGLVDDALIEVTRTLRGKLPALLVRLYNSGYKAGHHDTVEGGYTDICSCDMNTYHDDVVAELVGELLSAQRGLHPPRRRP